MHRRWIKLAVDGKPPVTVTMSSKKPELRRLPQIPTGAMDIGRRTGCKTFAGIPFTSIRPFPV